MFITADMLLAHAFGDYILQSDKMATNKMSSSLWAFIHVCFYTLPFIFITQSLYALLFIAITHFFIDRFQLAKYVTWIKNRMWGGAPWHKCSKTGFNDDMPPWLSTWLLVIVDNIMHVTCNGIALHYF